MGLQQENGICQRHLWLCSYVCHTRHYVSIDARSISMHSPAILFCLSSYMRAAIAVSRLCWQHSYSSIAAVAHTLRLFLREELTVGENFISTPPLMCPA